MKIVSMFALVLGFAVSVSAAPNNKLIVKFAPGYDVSKFKFMGATEVEALIPELGIYAVQLPAKAKANRAAASSLRSQPGVIYAQEDHVVTRRAGNKPNDKSFGQQWDMIRDNNNFGIDAMSAWNMFGGGGVDVAGREVVVAVVDGGVDIEHEDLAQNIWVNKGEIPNNKKDDDGNGFVDDVNGWNAYNNSGAVESDYHGTHVAGTIGAVGNNSIGMAGIGWNTKILVVNGSSGTTSVVLKAYGYVLKQKQLWVTSGGKQGANIVATNSSFGVDYGDCKSSQYASWNDIYNEMGKVGILHAIATANLSIDVDAKGDVPTGCESPYIIAVTNTDKAGKKNSGAAWGLKHIDIAAPGTNTYSTMENNTYGTLTGTSMATPHVAGAVAYMHSVGSQKFNDEYMKDPAAGALALKQHMLDTVIPTTELTGKTVSGGILNLLSASQAISAH